MPPWHMSPGRSARLGPTARPHPRAWAEVAQCLWGCTQQGLSNTALASSGSGRQEKWREAWGRCCYAVAGIETMGHDTQRGTLRCGGSDARLHVHARCLWLRLLVSSWPLGKSFYLTVHRSLPTPCATFGNPDTLALTPL